MYISLVSWRVRLAAAPPHGRSQHANMSSQSTIQDSSLELRNMAASSSPYVTLISNDGFEFIVSRDAACVAGTIKKMLDPHSAVAPCNILFFYVCTDDVLITTGSFAESISGRCTLGNIKYVSSFLSFLPPPLHSPLSASAFVQATQSPPTSFLSPSE